ncbi:hypothetical protein FOL47_000711 [Perkinsus chesapeaki]|uniref:CCHC-type domain-containing protein n=1 Tax=Perkinsus chesapeaki TaxID=330153 RepID=A0A7J6KWP9_PERCH|nr:hypothetical protein FOL47_000711 [Perkinsus chesapeaki]
MSKSGEEESTTSKYTAVPKPYSGSGNFREWRLRFTYCQEANGWSDEMALKKLPTLLEKVALVTFTRLSKDDKISLSKVLNKLEEEFAPEQSTAFDEFSNAHYNPTDSLDLYSYQLTELLDSSGLSLDEKSRDALLIAKFIASLPSDLQVDLRKSRESINSLQGALRMAKRLQAIQTTPSSLSPPVTTSSSPNPVPMVDTSNLPSVQLSNPLEKPDPAVAAIADLTEAIRQEQEMMVNFISRRGKGKGGKGRSRYGRYQYQRRPTRNAYLNNRRHQTHQAPWAPTCDYCGIPGHFWRECRRRLRDQGVTTNYGNFDGPRNGRLPDNRDRQPREVNGYTDNDVTMYDTSNLIDTVETRYTSENDCGTGMDRARLSHPQ